MKGVMLKEAIVKMGKLAGTRLGHFRLQTLSPGWFGVTWSGFTAAEKDAIWQAAPRWQDREIQLFPVGVNINPGNLSFWVSVTLRTCRGVSRVM